MIKKFTLAAALFAALTFSASATEVISLVVPLAPGGATDIIARKLAKQMSDKGTPTIVVNKPGADRIIGTNYAAEATPDGKTLLIGSSSDVVLLPLLNSPLLKFNEDSFIPVSLIGSASPMLTANPGIPANNFKEFLALIKKDPGKYPIGSFGKLTEIQARAIFKMAGAQPTIITYKSDPLESVDIISGVLPFGIQTIPATRQFIESGKIKPIAVLGDRREKQFPKVGTVAEVNGWHSKFWYGVFAPPGTPDWLVKKLNLEITVLMESPEMKAELESLGFDYMFQNQSQFSDFYKQQLKFYRPLVAEFLEKK
jgi:tripartite-type tricarboxylate transporter receptor subunit TctC